MEKVVGARVELRTHFPQQEGPAVKTTTKVTDSEGEFSFADVIESWPPEAGIGNQSIINRNTQRRHTLTVIHPSDIGKAEGSRLYQKAEETGIELRCNEDLQKDILLRRKGEM